MQPRRKCRDPRNYFECFEIEYPPQPGAAPQPTCTMEELRDFAEEQQVPIKGTAAEWNRAALCSTLASHLGWRAAPRVARAVSPVPLGGRQRPSMPSDFWNCLLSTAQGGGGFSTEELENIAEQLGVSIPSEELAAARGFHGTIGRGYKSTLCERIIATLTSGQPKTRRTR